MLHGFWLQFWANIPEVLGVTGVWLAGRKRRSTWVLAMIGDAVWLFLSVALAVWIWIPWTLVAIGIHIRNYILWKPKSS